MRGLAQKSLNLGDLLEKLGMGSFFKDILIMWTSINV